MAIKQSITREANAGMKWQDKFHRMGKMTNFMSATKYLPTWPPEPAKLDQEIPPHLRSTLREAMLGGVSADSGHDRLTWGLWYQYLGRNGRDHDPEYRRYQRWAEEYPHMAEHLESYWDDFFRGIENAKR